LLTAPNDNDVDAFLAMFVDDGVADNWGVVCGSDGVAYDIQRIRLFVEGKAEVAAGEETTAVVPPGRRRRAAGRYGANAAGGAGAHAEQVTSPAESAGAGPDRVAGRVSEACAVGTPFTAPPGRGTRA
jgi:hypothetical protein